jgi:hypothetical protein
LEITESMAADDLDLVRRLLEMKAAPQLAARIRRQARHTAARFAWPEVIRTHIAP